MSHLSRGVSKLFQPVEKVSAELIEKRVSLAI